MKKVIFILSLLIATGLLFFFLFATKSDQFDTMKEMGAQMVPPPQTVSTSLVEKQIWQNRLKSIGSIEPIQGVLLEAEVAGVVEKIGFENGDAVKKGQLLIQLDIAVEKAQLKAAEASARLAKVELERGTRLRESGNVPQSDLDRAQAEFDRSNAEVENFKAQIGRKTIKAPFTGKVGIRQVNLGQYVAIGAPIIEIQSYKKVYVNFTLPQQALSRIKVGNPLKLQNDVYPENNFEGLITAISPQIDQQTRTVEIQGTIDNPEELLRSGLFVKIEVELPEKDEVLVVPATAVKYSPYGNSIFKIKSTDTGTIAHQEFIRTGKRQGDYISVIGGAEAGEEVISAGAFKVRNGASVSVNNDLAPDAELVPTPPNS